jgi:uncharacterized protein (DUF433 family)
MKRVKWQERIAVDADLHHGDACIKGTRIPAAIIVGSLADGMTAEEIQEQYPQLTQEDIQAALAYEMTRVSRPGRCTTEGPTQSACFGECFLFRHILPEPQGERHTSGRTSPSPCIPIGTTQDHVVQ